MTKDTASAGVNDHELTQFIERIERLEEDKKAVSDDIKDVYLEAKGRGFETKIMRQVVKLRKKSREERLEEEAVLDLYKGAVGLN